MEDDFDSDYEDVCPICNVNMYKDCLAGKHMCRIVVTFTCCGKWTSYSGRYNVEEGRVMGQRCKQCGADGKASKKWTLADGLGGGGETKPHRSELCEACARYGNCRGVFFDPFQMAMAVQMHTGRPATWQRHQRTDLWVTEVDGAIVVLQPHVFVSQAWDG